MSKKNIIVSVCVLLCAVCAFTVSFYFLIDYYNVKQAKDEIVAFSNLFEKQLNDELDIKSVASASESLLRVSVIDEDGEVVADSSLRAEYENHADREEFIAALKTGESGVLRRKSDTLETDMLYYARKISVEGKTYVLRVSMPIAGVNGYLPAALSVSALILSALAAAVFAAFLSIQKASFLPMKMIKEGLEDVAKGTFTPSIPHFPRQEMNEIYLQISDLSLTIHNLLSSQEGEKNKIDFILDNMDEGLIALDGDEILLMNRKAKEIFSLKEKQTNIRLLFEDQSFIERLTKKDGARFDEEIGGRIYEIRKNEADVFDAKASVALFRDVTDRRKAEAMREEFFTNASHELKTPVTAIKGFCEMLASEKNLTPEQQKKYVAQIEKNTFRLMRLVSDMTQLSKLDAGAQKGEKEDVDVFALASEIAEDLQASAKKRGITIEITGKLILNCRKELLGELLNNVLDNAVKYNVENGKVFVRLYPQKKRMEIEDTGIGIEKEHLPRIFERFYRADKSRSAKAGGTGLGLSIVKHIALCENWKIDLSSEKGKGTLIVLDF